MKERKIRSKPNLKLVLFAAAGVLLSVAVLLIFLFTEKNFAFMVTMCVFSSIFILAGLIILWVQLLNFVVLYDDKLVAHWGFIKKTVKLENIEKIVNKDGMFDIYTNGKRLTSLSSDDENSKRIIVLLEKSGIKVKW